jgi:hypothetical protein
MRYYYITFRSVTHAQRGERILAAAGIRCSLQRTPHWMEEQGCGYCLKLYAADIADVVQLLRRSRVSMRKVYVQHTGGQLEEVRL